MQRNEISVCDFGWQAREFDLPGVDGKRHTLASTRGPKGALVMFICNHCPYVKAVLERIVRDCAELAPHGIGSVAIMSNDPADYPEDSFHNMKRIARERGFGFPYVLDESQEVAKAYSAVCTPEFFGFNAQLELQYHGRLDASKTTPLPGARRDLFEAMLTIANGKPGPRDQIAGVGCSIKWRRSGLPG
jgi:peroxiredoxin